MIKFKNKGESVMAKMLDNGDLRSYIQFRTNKLMKNVDPVYPPLAMS